ncbi:YybH family protein [Fulvivirga sedimenti]|uniref:DUF4440 domain-containing protein n=1 Tax=Fulvivirga sedimenti TaxID=2879465 RepID=A0A9X1HYM2_9BACT|nr:DUF4440 domain-containing protein [Fulvivirga sedimenti]MCA6078839.1 DUF4440 domain-containing protein [Fulvivirga sedimenti]
MKYILSLVFIIAGYSIHAQEYYGNAEEIDEILAAIHDFSDAYMEADYDRLAAHYTTDARILPPGTDIIQGRELIQKRWILPENVKIMFHKATPHELRITGDYAYDLGVYEGKTRRADGSVSSWKGKYIIIWQKVDGKWLIYADAWNRTDD